MTRDISTSWHETAPGRRAFYARPTKSGKHPLIVVFFEVFGLNEHFQHVASQIAENGYCAVVPDLFDGKVFSYSDIQAAMNIAKDLKSDTIMEHITQSIDRLNDQPEVDTRRCGLIGFCMGGRISFMAACKLGSRIKAAVSFYGGSIAPTVPDRMGRTSLLTEENLSNLSAPLFLAYGSQDTHIPPEEHARIVEALGRHKKRYTLALFDGPHAFASDRRESYRPAAAAQAWKMAYEHFSAL